MMEEVVNKLARTGSTLAAHPDFRMTVPPRSSKGKTYEDLGQTDYKNITTYGRKRAQKPSPKKNVEDDDDELDLLSAESRRDKDTEPPRKKVNRKGRKAANRPSDPKTRTRQEAEPFPLSSPAPDSDPQSDHSTPRPVKKVSSAFPTLQPLDASTTKKKPAEFPTIPPLSPKSKSKKKPRSRSGSEDYDADELSLHPDDDIKTRGAPRPFPMSKELLKRTSPSPPRPPPKAGASKSVRKKSSRKLAQFPMSTQMLQSIPSKASPERCPYVPPSRGWMPRVLSFTTKVHRCIPQSMMVTIMKIPVSISLALYMFHVSIIPRQSLHQRTRVSSVPIATRCSHLRQRLPSCTFYLVQTNTNHHTMIHDLAILSVGGRQ
jgi:hypothetical protein